MSEPRLVASQQRYAGHVITVRTDTVELGDGTVDRDVVAHPGAVGVVALDDQGRVALVEQYRHPVGLRLWELPAGLLDEPGETASDAVARELVEEAGLRAARWSVLVDTYTSPGMTDEINRIYLAQDLSSTDRPAGEAEEADLVLAWVPLDAAVARVLAGELRNAMACVGLLAAARTLTSGVDTRPVDAPWPSPPGAGGHTAHRP